MSFVTELEAVRFVNSFEDFLFENEKDHLKALLERGVIRPGAIFGATALELRDLIRRNPLSGSSISSKCNKYTCPIALFNYYIFVVSLIFSFSLLLVFWLIMAISLYTIFRSSSVFLLWFYSW